MRAAVLATESGLQATYLARQWREMAELSEDLERKRSVSTGDSKGIGNANFIANQPANRRSGH